VVGGHVGVDVAQLQGVVDGGVQVAQALDQGGVGVGRGAGGQLGLDPQPGLDSCSSRPPSATAR
jgi:hypothetical protein